MDTREISELIKKITLEELEKASNKNGQIKELKKALILIPRVLFSYNKFYTYLQDTYKDYKLDIVSCNVKERFGKYSDSNINYIDILDIKQNSTLFDSIEDYEKIGLPISDLTVIDDILEIKDNTLSQLVNFLIMQEKTIEAIWSYKNNSKRMKEIRNSQKKLEVLGINSTNINKPTEKAVKQSHMITEKDVLAAHSKSKKTIVAMDKQLVTPLAKDKARELKIMIEYA